MLFNIFLYYIYYIYISNPICVRRHAKRKKSNMFKDMGLADKRVDLDFFIRTRDW